MASKPNQIPLPPWGNALAGATGAVLANAVVYPLDMSDKILANTHLLISLPTDHTVLPVESKLGSRFKSKANRETRNLEMRRAYIMHLH